MSYFGDVSLELNSPIKFGLLVSVLDSKSVTRGGLVIYVGLHDVSEEACFLFYAICARDSKRFIIAFNF